MAVVYSYLLNLQISVIGNSSSSSILNLDEKIKKIRDNVQRGGGRFEIKVNRNTTHAILIGDKSRDKAEIDSAMSIGIVVVSSKWLDVCTQHNELVPGTE